jgi:hypothetical protein
VAGETAGETAGTTTWCWVTVIEPGGPEIARWPLRGRGTPDMAVADSLARLGLSARRAGARLLLRDVCDELEEVLELAGLRGELVGQTEGGEQRRGVEEEAERPDPAA